MANKCLSNIFALNKVGKIFDNKLVVNNLTLNIAQGERVAVIGPSGAGKTTLFRMLSGVLKPDEGELSIMGIPSSKITKKSFKRIKKEIGVLYQTDNLISQLRVVHNVLMGKLGEWSLAKSILSLLWPQDLRSAEKALRQVELEDKLWSMPGELSGGQQQRVAIARLIVQNPLVMLADEPVSQLDIRLGREIIVLLSEITAKTNSTLMVNLHTLELLDGFFERVIALKDGALFWEGKPQNIDNKLLFDLYGSEYKSIKLGLSH